MSGHNQEPSFYLVAGEASGDRHAAALLKELKKNYPSSVFRGVGGRHLRAAGQDQLFDLAEHAVVGLTDVLLNYFKFKRFFDRVVEDIRFRCPDVVVLVDFPGFNLRLADKVRAEFPETRIIYYISPQVWAWKAGRAQAMAKTIDLLLVIFPFEETWFAEKTPGFNVRWIGHPILDRWQMDEWEAAGNDEELPKRITLLPGSRKKEISVHLPVFLETVRKLDAYLNGYSYMILASDPEAEVQIRSILGQSHAEKLDIRIQGGYQLTHLSRSRLALVASGTATLECALAGVPMLVVYKTNPITYLIGRRLVKLKYISIVNLISDTKAVPEFLQGNANPEALFQGAKTLLESKEASEGMRTKLKLATAKLGKPGANARAVREIVNFLRPFGWQAAS